MALSGSRQVHQNDLTVLDGSHAQHLLIGNRYAVSSLCTQTIDFNGPGGRNQVCLLYTSDAADE